MARPDLVIVSRRVVTPAGTRPAAVVIDGGTIRAVEPLPGPTQTAERVDAGDAVVMPGVVDTHVHVNEPGRTEWEGFETASMAAAAGGVTTLVDMPLNSSPVTTSVDALRRKVDAARGAAYVDYGCWGGLVPANADQLVPLLDAGVLGFKCFLVDSGLEEFPPVGEAELERAMPVLATHDAVLLVHAEAPGPIAAARPAGGALARRYADYLRSRPAEAEQQAIDLLIRLCERHRCRVHIVHLASADALAQLASAKRTGLPISVETCPHYLTFAAEEIPDGATTFKCAPPIRDGTHRERLWRGLAEGIVDLVASDHSPCPPAMKRLDRGDFVGAWGGIASLQLSLAAVWTGAQARGCPVDAVARWMCAAPARLAGLAPRKGALVPGGDADILIWDPESSFVVSADMVRHRHKATPYEGMRLHGSVVETYVRGRRVYDRGTFTAEPGGRWLERSVRG